MSEGRVKPALPGGFNDFPPKLAIERERLLGEVVSVFRKYGFAPLETPIVEFREVLIGEAGETEKEIFDIAGDEEDKTLSLRFDLTVGLARFVAANPELPLPFKRYQVGPVFRGEKPQAGRYRQFVQMDIDTVGARSTLAEAEVLSAMREALGVFSPGEFFFRINHRAILEGLCEAVGLHHEEDQKQLMRVLDKLEKIGLDGVLQELSRKPEHDSDRALGLDDDALRLVEKFLSGADESPLTLAHNLLGNTSRAPAGIEAIEKLLEHFDMWGMPKKLITIDLSVARGLDYYTGTVFETVVVEKPQWGSVMSGGRYDGLIARFSGQEIPSVGGSIGFDRLFRLLYDDSDEKKVSEVEAVVMVFEDRFLPRTIEFVRQLHEAGISAEIPLTSDRSFRGQMNYALKRGAKYLVIYGDGEEEKGVVAIKNLDTRKQQEIALDSNWAARIKEI